MKVLKSFLKIFFIFFLIIIPTCLILYNIFVDFLGCYLIINNNNIKLEKLLYENNIDYNNTKIIFLDTTAGDGEHLTIINKNFSVKNEWISVDESELVKYVEENGIDVYDTVTKINYVYILAIAIIIFFKKLFENIDMFSKFKERDN